jgi:hypothetical protein
MSVSEFSPPPSPKSPASSISSLSDVSSDAHSRFFSDDRDVGTIAGHTDLNTTVVSDSKHPLPTWEDESRLDYPIEEEERELPSPVSRSSPRSRGSKHTRSRSSTRKSTPKSTPRPTAPVEAEFVTFDDLYAPVEYVSPEPRIRQSSARKRARTSSPGLGKQPTPTYQTRSRKVSARSYRRSSGEPRMSQVPVCECTLTTPI